MNDPRFIALSQRDAAQDGAFVYAVATTGVYCRPSCAARTPRPENVAFFDTPDDAERAGYRACLRCRPGAVSRQQEKRAVVTALCRFIEQCEASPDLKTLAARAGWSPSHTHRTFKAITGVTPKAYAEALRQRRLQDGLTGGAEVTRAMYDAGYSGTGRFYAGAAGALGMKPRAFREGGAEQAIHHGLAPCSLGQVLVACTELGVCAILLGDDEDELEQDLRRRFPRAAITRGLDDAVLSAVVRMVERPELPHDLPLDIQGRAFQRRVWEALRAIPPGQTRSYGELARELGQPSAARAVAGACAANPVAVAVPCHRVVRADGSLSGYRWGLDRKRALLEREKTHGT